jgi:hypothetical protein
MRAVGGEEALLFLSNRPAGNGDVTLELHLE